LLRGCRRAHEGGVTYSEQHLEHPIRDYVTITVQIHGTPDEKGGFGPPILHQYVLDESGDNK
jgi:hypothetical protein